MNASITSSHSTDSILCLLVPVSAQPMPDQALHDFIHRTDMNRDCDLVFVLKLA